MKILSKILLSTLLIMSATTTLPADDAPQAPSYVRITVIPCAAKWATRAASPFIALKMHRALGTLNPRVVDAVYPRVYGDNMNNHYEKVDRIQTAYFVTSLVASAASCYVINAHIAPALERWLSASAMNDYEQEIENSGTQ